MESVVPVESVVIFLVFSELALTPAGSCFGLAIMRIVFPGRYKVTTQLEKAIKHSNGKYYKGKDFLYHRFKN